MDMKSKNTCEIKNHKSPALNAGVQGATGIEFQKHAALYVFLENVKRLEASNFFVCIEHHDDVLFCHLNEHGHFSEIDVYQAKKSADKWTVASEEFHIMLKMLKTCDSIMADPARKTEDFRQSSYFATNNTVEIVAKPDKVRVDETNSSVMFRDLSELIRAKISSGILGIDRDAPTRHLDSLGFTYLDLGRTAKTQINQLVGRFGEVYGNTVADHRAAVLALIALFRRVELAFNQGSTARLMDISKRVDKKEFIEALNIITTKQKAYVLWRERGQSLAAKLNITVAEREKFEVEISNSFDMFKDTNQQEHLKILRFVEENRSVLAEYYSDEECIDALLNRFRAANRSQLLDSQVKAAVYAAYIEIRS